MIPHTVWIKEFYNPSSLETPLPKPDSVRQRVKKYILSQKGKEVTSKEVRLALDINSYRASAALTTLTRLEEIKRVPYYQPGPGSPSWAYKI